MIGRVRKLEHELDTVADGKEQILRAEVFILELRSVEYSATCKTVPWCPFDAVCHWLKLVCSSTPFYLCACFYFYSYFYFAFFSNSECGRFHLPIL